MPATDAILVYGYDLGGPDEGWRVQGVGEYGELPPLDWYDEDDEDHDFTTAVQNRLMTVVGGFTETWTPDARENGYFDRKEAAEKRVGVTVATYCSSSSPMYALAAHETTVHRGHLDYLDPRDLAERPFLMNWDEKLAAAVDALGLTPVQERPRWFLVSFAEM